MVAPARLVFLALVMLSTAARAPRAEAQTARVSMSASASRVTVGEPFVVEIRADITGGQPDDIELPDFGTFEVVGRQVSRPFSFSFGFGSGGQHGTVQSQIVHAFTMRAREPGTFTIKPAVVVVGARRFASTALTIEATGSAVPAAGTAGVSDARGSVGSDPTAPPEGPLDGATYDDDAFVRTVISKPRITVGEQLTVTVYLYVRGGLPEAPAITKEPTADGFWVQDLLPPQRALAPVRQQVNGRVFNAYVLRRFAAFALREGTLKIGETAVEVGGRPSLFDLLSGPREPLRRTGVPVVVETAAPPARKDPSAPTFVGDLTLAAAVDRREARVGDAVTLTVTAQGHGNLKSLALPDPRIEGMEVLTPEIEDQVTADLDKVGGKRVFVWLLLPRKPGSAHIAPVAVDTYDPTAAAYTRVVTEPLALTITGEAVPVARATASSDATPVTADAPQFGPVRTRSALLRRQLPLQQHPWFWWAVAAGPLLFMLSRLTAATRQRLNRAHADKRGERAFRSAQAALDAAQSAARAGDSQGAHASIATAIKSAVEARLDEPVGSLTYVALRQHLVARGMTPPLVERVVSQLEAGELSRFNPLVDNTNELQTALERSRGVVRELERFRPGEAR